MPVSQANAGFMPCVRVTPDLAWEMGIMRSRVSRCIRRDGLSRYALAGAACRGRKSLGTSGWQGSVLWTASCSAGMFLLEVSFTIGLERQASARSPVMDPTERFIESFGSSRDPSPAALRLATALAERLDVVVPRPFSVRAEGGLVSIYRGATLDHSCEVAVIFDQEVDTENPYYEEWPFA